MISTLSTLCFETSQHAADVRDKIHIADAKPLPPKDEDARREKIFAGLTDEKDRLILCLPEIANAEYGRANALDKIGWAYFHDLITKWLHGKAYVMKDKYDNGGQEPYFVDWNWLMGYERFANAVGKMKQQEYLFSPTAREKLSVILENERYFKEKEGRFDFIRTDPALFRGHAFQGYSMEGYGFVTLIPPMPDGLQTVLAKTTIYALAAGHTEVGTNGERKIFVNEIALFIYDGFDFEGLQWLGGWICLEEDKCFSLTGIWLWNEDFRLFRQRTGYGCDFRTMSIPELVWKGEFEYVSK